MERKTDERLITFVIPSRNNLEFLKLAYESLRNLETDHYILVLNDASEDGTQEWLEGLDDDRLIVHENPGPERIGIVGMFDKGIEMAPTEIIMAFHADMVAAKDLDIEVLKHLERGTVVTATRVEPPLHPTGPEKITRNFGEEVDEFNLKLWYSESSYLKENRVTGGIFAPWCMYKEDFLKIGGHDILFAPQSKEDSDLFNRFVLKGYTLKQPWTALVYHFTSRGSRFNKHSGGDIGKNSPEWLKTTSKNMRNFIRKWGTPVLHTPLMKPIIRPKYRIGFVIKNCYLKLLEDLEPYCDIVYTDCHDVPKYIETEQPNTLYLLEEKINSLTYFEKAEKDDVVVEVDGKNLNNEAYSILMNLSSVLEKNKPTSGIYNIEGLKITIYNLQEYQNELIYVNGKV